MIEFIINHTYTEKVIDFLLALDAQIIAISKFLSLALTPATIMSCMLIVVTCFAKAVEGFMTQPELRTSAQWFAIALLVHFSGQMADNSYWGVTWDADWAGLSYKKFMFDHGVISNLPFRQCLTLYAVYAHVQGMLVIDNNMLRRFAIGITALTLIYVIRLLVAA